MYTGYTLYTKPIFTEFQAGHSFFSFLPKPNHPLTPVLDLESVRCSFEEAGATSPTSWRFFCSCKARTLLKGVVWVAGNSREGGGGVTACSPSTTRHKVEKDQSTACSTGSSKRYGSNGTTLRPSYSLR